MSLSRKTTVYLGLLAGGVMLALSGCGGSGYGSPVKLSGTVTVNDQPLANAIVTFSCTEPREPAFRAFTATAGSDGTYETQVYAGTYDISVSEAAAEGVDPGMASALAGQDLKPASGDLQAVVGTDAQTYDIKLTRGRTPAF